jgi:2-(1,2-epoxy-1,2-dihydrophenyl)acetyl-CoA isomerase
MFSTPTQQPPLLVERHGAIVHLCFNRPHALNAIDVPMAHALLEELRVLTRDSTVRAVVLRGAGKGFMAGGDLATLRADPLQGAKDLLEPLNRAVELMAALNAPVIAQVHGIAAGAGLSLMLQADFVLAAKGTRFNLAYINIGTSCDVGASWALPRLVGMRKALEIALLGDTLTCDEAERIGLINRVVSSDQLEKEVSNLAERLASGPTQAYGSMKRLMRTAFDSDLPSQLALETAAFAQCARTQDFRIGIESFYGKYPAQFTGK